jgi:hypothetical protein
MTFQTVTISWDEDDPALAPVTGTITFLLSSQLNDPASGIDVDPLPKTYPFSSAGQSDPLVANDSAGVTPAGSYYTITIGVVGAEAVSYQAQILIASGSAQKLSALTHMGS